MLQVNDPTGTFGFSYDNMGRLIGTTTQYTFLPSNNFTNSYTYDANSNRLTLTDPQGGVTSYVYDTLNRLSTLTPPTAFSSTGFGFTYDALSRRTQMTRPNGVTTNYSYDNLSHLLSVLHQVSSSTIDGAAYTYDSAGNRTAKTNEKTAVTSNYTYDPLYELTQVTQATNTTEIYSYDPVGNRLSSLGVSSYTNNSSNELTSTPSTTYSYDNNGNTLTKVTSAGTTTYGWDYQNRLTSITLPGTNGTLAFQYNAFGHRVQKVFTQNSSTTTTNYLYDGDSTVADLDQNGNVLARYTATQDIDEPLAELRSGTTSYYSQDGLGSVTSLTTSAGALGNTYSYDSFGNLTASSGTIANRFQYTAREFDPETGLYYYRARYYDLTIGRFLSEDPVGFSGDTINFYDYVSNNPPVFSDPSGNKKFHGTWCGPKWTGGHTEPFIPSHDVPGYYAPPVDYVDSICSHHDKCFSKCREKHPCSPLGRRFCERGCDFHLVGGMLSHPADAFNPWAYVIGLGIALDLVPPAGPNGGADPDHPVSCPSCGGSGPPPAGVH